MFTFTAVIASSGINAAAKKTTLHLIKRPVADIVITYSPKEPSKNPVINYRAKYLRIYTILI